MGIVLTSASYSTIENNTCKLNRYGINLTSSSSNLVIDNLLKKSREYGVGIDNGMFIYSENNYVYSNRFIDNYEDYKRKSQAYVSLYLSFLSFCLIPIQ